MTQAPQIIIYGHDHFPMGERVEIPDRSGLDKVEQTWHSSRRDAFRVDKAVSGGAVSVFPGYSQVYIDKVRSVEEVPGMAYDLQLVGLGLLDGREKIIPEPLAQPPEDFDQVVETVFTTDPQRYQRGNAHRDYTWMLISEPPPKVREIGTIWRLQVPYKGIVHSALDGEGKPVAKDRSYRLTVNNQTVSFSANTTLGSGGSPNGFVDEAGVFNGWVDKMGQVEIPRVQIVETYLNLDGPPTGDLPCCLTPENAPPVKNVFPTLLAGAPILYQWPWGWSLISATGMPLLRDRIGHATLAMRTPWLCTRVFEYRQQFTPR